MWQAENLPVSTSCWKASPRRWSVEQPNVWRRREAADQIRDGGQPQDRQGARDRAADCDLVARERGDRMMVSCCGAWVRLYNDDGTVALFGWLGKEHRPVVLSEQSIGDI